MIPHREANQESSFAIATSKLVPCRNCFCTCVKMLQSHWHTMKASSFEKFEIISLSCFNERVKWKNNEETWESDEWHCRNRYSPELLPFVMYCLPLYLLQLSLLLALFWLQWQGLTLREKKRALEMSEFLESVWQIFFKKIMRSGKMWSRTASSYFPFFFSGDTPKCSQSVWSDGALWHPFAGSITFWCKGSVPADVLANLRRLQLQEQNCLYRCRPQMEPSNESLWVGMK